MKRVVILIMLIGICAGTGGLRADDGTAAPDSIVLQFDPQALHREMWESLRPRLAQKQAVSLSLAGETSSNWQEYDMGYYRLELDIDHIAHVVYGRVGIHGTVAVSSLDSVMVNLLNTMTVDSVYDSGGNLVYSHLDDHVTVYLGSAVSQGGQFDFTVVYHGTPASSAGFLGLTFSERSGLPLITTLSEPMGARSWWPCNDISRDKVDSVDIVVTVDTSLEVSSNGLIVSDTDNGDGTHTVHWHNGYPIAAYLVSLGIHPYAVWYDWYNYSPTDSMPLRFHVFPDHESYSQTKYTALPHMIEVLSDVFGEYPFIEEKYGLTHFDWSGAMEHQTNTSTTSSSFGYSLPVLVHELGHQWWGDMVTCDDWHHIWINEGFAVYSEALFFEADSGIDYYHAYMNSFEWTSGGSIYIEDTTSIWNIFGWIVYDKGGWVLHMLRHIIGDEAFFTTLAEYREQYQWASASTEDFQGVAEAVSGMDLDYFFQEWIYGTYRPNYRYSYVTEADPGGGYNTYLHIRQIQLTNPQVFTMPIDVVLETTGGPGTQTVFNSLRGQNFVLHTDNAVTDVELDPDRWISRIALSEPYTLHIISESLDGGELVTPYDDTVVVACIHSGYNCDVISGALPPGWELEASSGAISGSAQQTGVFEFTIRAVDAAYSANRDSVSYTVTINPPSVQRPGDANADGVVNVGDAVYLVNYIFKAGLVPPVLNWADVNADCVINVGDAVYMINHIFKSGLAPQAGCVE